MSLAVAVPFGVGSAVVYGASIVVQHRMAQAHVGDEGEASASALLQMARNPVWLMAIGGDLVGFLLQIVALSLGSVVVIQPLVVLMLPVALVVSALTGGHHPRRADYLGVLGVLGGLAVFLALIGRPAAGHVPRPHVIGMAVLAVLVLGAGLVLTVIGRGRVCRGVMYGAVAGLYFGTLAVLVDAASDRFSKAGLHGLLATPRGFVPLIGIVLVGAGGIVLTQLSFQVGALGATLPANLATDPLTGVLLGVLLLRENVPISAWRAVVYALCLVAVVAGAIRLADPEHERRG
ncbi:DMT family transporter [uncultured Jatrophihabitans sp.]|uniref:DMT family transporter n=1 Tax=uncultured Jatrophihabitans sp. TaxID=1610747 RepID=UPI0035CC7056